MNINSTIKVNLSKEHFSKQTHQEYEQLQKSITTSTHKKQRVWVASNYPSGKL